MPNSPPPPLRLEHPITFTAPSPVEPRTEAAAFATPPRKTLAAAIGAARSELLAGPLIGDLTSRESLALDDGRGGSPVGGELIVAIDPAGFLGEATAAHLARAEAMFAAIEAQGARLPSARRYAARARSLSEGVVVPAALHVEIMAIGAAA